LYAMGVNENEVSSASFVSTSVAGSNSKNILNNN